MKWGLWHMTLLKKYSWANLKKRLSTKFFLIVFGCSMVSVFLSIILQMFLEYRTDVNRIINNVSFIKESYLSSIEDSVYKIDEAQVKLQLKGILQLQGVEYCDVVEKKGMSNKIFEGDPESRKDLVREFPLTYQNARGEEVSIGTLTVHASFEGAYNRLWNHASLQIIFSTLSIILTASLVFILFQRHVARHLTVMASHTERLSMDKLGSNLKLPRPDVKDELGLVADSINSLCDRVKDHMSKHLRAEEALADSEKYYRDIFDETNDAVFIHKLDGAILDVNKVMTDMYGFTRKEALNCSIEDLSLGDPPYSGQEALKNLNNAYKKGAQIFEWLAKKKNGELFWAEVHLKHSFIRGQDRIIAVVRDITERKNSESEKRQMQEQLQHAEKMEAIGTLAGGVAHDLNNILSGIVSYPDLMLMDIPEDSPLIEPLITIKSSGTKAATIVQDLLTLARRGITVNKVINLNDLIDDYLKSSEYKKIRAYYPDTQVTVNLSEDLLPILGSPVHLSNTIMNLVLNAAEAISGIGLITISTTNRYIDKPIKGYDEVKEGDYIVLTVADNGIGISPADLQKIFDPFYTKKTMGRSGTGLGMAVVWGTVKDHKGYINAESTKGKGTVLELFFPVTREGDKKEATVSIHACMGKNEKILVVDDMEEQRKIVSSLLTKLGYSVDVVSSGEEAIEYVKNNNPDLLILDMIMDPGIDGLDTYKKIIEINHGQKAIIASGFSETDRVKEALKLGAGQYIKKPYTLMNIGLAIKAELNR